MPSGARSAGNAPLAGADALVPFRGQQRRGPRYRPRDVIDPQRHGADRRAVQLEMLGRGAVLLGVQDQVGAALAEQFHGFGAMVPGMAEPERAQEFAELAAGFFIDGEFEEFYAVEARRLRAAPAAPAPASVRINERSPSRAVSRAGAARNSSLNISNEIGPR